MKSDHRHDLKTNELAEWIANLPQWARENGKMTIYISIVAVLVIGSALWYWRKTKAESVQSQLDFTNLITRLSQSKMQVLMGQSRGVDSSYMLVETAANFQSTAENVTDGQMAALALIKRAEALRAELHYRQQSVSQTDLRTAINQAKTAYTKAIEKAAGNPSLTAIARFGLGLCEEEIGNFDGAEQIYRDIVSNGDFEGTTALAKARHRLETMSDYRQKIVFKAAPKPAFPEFLQPPIPLRPIDDTMFPQDPNRVPVVPEVKMGPEPNPALLVPEVKTGPEPNGVSESLKINLRPLAPNLAPVVPDINVPGE